MRCGDRQPSRAQDAATLRARHAALHELLGKQLNVSESGIYFFKNYADCDPLGIRAIRKSGLKWRLAGSLTPLVDIDPAQPDFFKNLARAVTEKRFLERKAALKARGVPTGGVLDKIMRERIAPEVDRDLWNGLPSLYGKEGDTLSR